MQSSVIILVAVAGALSTFQTTSKANDAAESNRALRTRAQLLIRSTPESCTRRKDELLSSS